MPVYELINPSDAYTFEAPDLTTAGVVAVLLSSSFGARRVDADEEETTPILFGWDEWLKDRGVDKEWVKRNAGVLADAFDSFLIGTFSGRQDVLDMLAELPEEKREAWRAKRQDRHRTSMNQIGEAAYQNAKAYRKVAAVAGQ